MKNFTGYIIAFTLLVGIASCTDNNEIIKKETSIEAGIYVTDIALSTEIGERDEVTTRGFNAERGTFTDSYDFPDIYIHATNDMDSEDHKKIRIPITEETETIDGETFTYKKIHLEIVVSENGDYTLRKSEGDSEAITLSSEETVFFSNLSTPYWEAKIGSLVTPVSGHDILLEDKEKNIELLRSNGYKKEDLIQKLVIGTPQIEMSRCTTGFRVYFMFGDEAFLGNSNYDEELWKESLYGYGPENFYIKLYMGPNFSHKYDMYKDSSVGEPKEGYYVTNNGNYVPFKASAYGYQGSSGLHIYRGYGYETAGDKHLLSPLDDRIDTKFSIYAFVKFSASTADANNKDFLASDENSKYFQTEVKGSKVELNRVHYIIMVFSYKDLQEFFPKESAITRSYWEGPEKINITPAKIIIQ